MPLRVLQTTKADIPSLIDILFTAFQHDPLLIGTCYPDTPANRQWWIENVTSQLSHPETLLLKVVDEEDNIISWAKWLLPSSITTHQRLQGGDEGEVTGAVNPSLSPSPDMNLTACQSLADGQYKMRKEVLAGREHLWLNAIATSPNHQRRGAATMLVQYGVDIADGKGLECFSACTTQANQNMKRVFERFGFEVVAREEVVEGRGQAVHAGLRQARSA